MNKTKTNILAAVIGILLGSIYIFTMTSGALAQDISSAEIQVEVSSGCDWSGTPYASNLTVSDNDICVLTGIHNVGAFNVYVEDDADSSGNNLPLQRAGGQLVIGDGTIDTDITFGGTMTMDGILEIGVTGNPAFSSNLQIDGTSAISNTGSDGIVTIYANSSDDHTIELGDALTIGSATTTGSFTNNDDATTNTMTSVDMYGTFENLAGTITLSSTFTSHGTSSVDNDGILNLGTGTSGFNDTTEFNNSGTLTTPAGSIYVYYGQGAGGGATVTNTGTFTNGYHTLYGTTTFDNTGIINSYRISIIGAGVFDNNSGGNIDLIYHLFVNGSLPNAPIFNNNVGATITVNGSSTMYGDGIINNYATYNADYFQFGFTNVATGGTFNNYSGITFVSPQNPAIDFQRGGHFHNQSTGTITVPNNISMTGLSSVYPAILTNDNSTAADALTVTGTINMETWADIDNSGNLTVNGASNIVFGADNTTAETINSTITNNATGYLDLNGITEAIFDEDIAVTNAGIIDVAVAATLNDTASINQTAGDFNAPSLELTDTTSGEADFTMSDGTVDITGGTLVYEGNSTNNNELHIDGGVLTTGYLRIGQDNTTNGGEAYMTGNSRIITTSGSHNHVYQGIFDIQSTNSVPIQVNNTSSILYVRGESAEEGYFYMAGTGTARFYEIDIYEYGNYYTNSGITDLRGYTLYVHGDTSDRGLFYIENGGEARGMYAIYMGRNTPVDPLPSTHGGEIQNYGKLWRGSFASVFIHMYNNAYLYNGATGDIDTYGGYINLEDDEDYAPNYSSVENASGGLINTSEFRTNLDGQEINNYGDFNVNFRGYVGANPTSGGGTFNNYDDLYIGNRVYVYNTGTFNNEEDAYVHGAQIAVQGSSAAFYQKEGTDAGSQSWKMDVTGISVSSTSNYGGLFENADYVRTDVLDVYDNGTFNGVLDATGDPSPDDAQDSYTYVDSGGGAYVGGDATDNGTLTIEGNATDFATLEIDQPFNIGLNTIPYGVVTIDGVLTMNGPGTNLFETYGEFYSGNYSVISLAGAPGILTQAGSYTEFAGTVTATSFETNGGYMCLGDYSGTFPSGTCTNNALDPSKTLTNSGTAFDAGGGANVDMYNDLTLTNGDLNINESTVFEMYGTSPLLDVQNNANIIVNGTGSSLYTEGQVDVQGSGLGNHGYLKIENSGGAEIAGTTNNIGSIDMPGTAGTDSSLTVDAGATVNLNDTHTSALGNSVLTIGINDVAGSEALYNQGDINLNSGSTQNIYLGTDTTTNFGLDGVLVYPNASFQHTNGSTGNLDINNSGIFAVFDDSNTDLDADINGETYVDGHFDWGDSDQPHGLLVGGQFRCQDYLLVDTDGLVEVLDNGVVTVAGSTTDVYGEVELNGELNAGDLTVYSGGLISSGDGSGFNFGEGCGPTGRFGCGISTNFYINATSLDVQSGGNISSDGVSILDTDTGSTIAHGGSYAGEGIPASGSPVATYGATKIAAPTYGTQGEGAGTSDIFNTHGGGGVEIYVAGDITIDGTVSANSGAITHDIDYGSLTQDFKEGAELTGTSGTAIIRAITTATATTGTLTIEILTGTFSNGDSLTDERGGSATATSNAVVNEAAGAGGTVIITQDLSAAPTTAIFTGSGTISANGGDATYPGGGGRISIDTPLLDDPDANFSYRSYDFNDPTAGTVENLGGYSGSAYASHGTTVYLGDSNNPDGTLIIYGPGTLPDATTSTDLTDTPTFDRVLSRTARADLTGASSQVCYNLGSLVTGVTCNVNSDFPDKPDSLNIRPTSEAGNPYDSADEPGYIAGKGNGVSDTPLDVADITPSFAMYFRNPANTSGDFDEVEIQVASDANFTSLLWDATGINSITLSTAVSDGEWTEDIEYAGSALSLSTTYYVRARFIDNDTTNAGLWTHADYNDQYKFQISSYTNLYIDNCNGVPANTDVVLTDDGTTTGDDMSILSGGRYAYGSCDVNMDTSESDWEVYINMAAGETGLEHTTLPTYEIDHIQNTSNDCTMVTDGTGTEQEWGYNVTTYPAGNASEQVVHDNVNSNTDCRRDTGSFPEACGNTGTDGYYNDSDCYFNLENLLLVGRDTIFDTDLGTAAGLTDGRFTVNFHANVGTMETAGDYDTVAEVTLTSNP